MKEDLFADLIPDEPLKSGQSRDRHSINLHMQPLAERLRPKTLDEVVGQEQLLGPGKPWRVGPPWCRQDNIGPLDGQSL